MAWSLYLRTLRARLFGDNSMGRSLWSWSGMRAKNHMSRSSQIYDIINLIQFFSLSIFCSHTLFVVHSIILTRLHKTSDTSFFHCSTLCGLLCTWKRGGVIQLSWHSVGEHFRLRRSFSSHRDHFTR